MPRSLGLPGFRFRSYETAAGRYGFPADRPQGVRVTNTLPRYREIAPSFLQWSQRWFLEMAARSGLCAPDAPLWELDDPRSVARDWIGYCPAQIGPFGKSRRLSFVSCSRLGSG